MLNHLNLFRGMNRFLLALVLVALAGSSSLADTTVRGLGVWPSDTSPNLLGLVRGRLEIDNLVTDDTGFSIEIGVGGVSKVFEFPSESCRLHRNGNYTCLANVTAPRRSRRQLLVRKRGSSGAGKVKFFLANTELPGPVTGSVSITLTSGGGTYSVDSGECTRRQRHTIRTRYRCADGTGVAARCANPDASDTTAPSSVSGMQLSTVGSDLQVDWTNPGNSDFGGVVLLRQARQPIFVNGATDGATLSVGDTIDGVDVVYVGEDASFTDTTAIDGINYAYTAIAHDCTHNYADVADQVMGVHALPTQRATLSISDPLGTPVVTVDAAPSDMDLSVSGAVTSGGTLSFDLTVTNNLSSALVHPKVEILSVSEGAASDTHGTTRDGDPFYRFMTTLPLDHYDGSQARLVLASGATADQGVVLTGVTGAVDPLVVELEIGFDPAVGYHVGEVNGDRNGFLAMFQDTGTNTIAPIEARGSGPAGGGMPHGGCGAVQFTADNRWFLCASSHAGVLKIYDMAEFGVQLEPSVLNFFINHDPTIDTQADIDDDIDLNSSPFRGLRLSPDGSRLYAAIGSTNTGGDLITYWSGMDVVEIDISDPQNPSELRRLSLETDGDDAFLTMHMALSPDGKTLAFSTVGRRTWGEEVIFVVDTVTMTQVGDVVEYGDFGTQEYSVSLTWRGNLGFVVAGMITSLGDDPRRTRNINEPFLFYADALDGFSTRTIQVTGRASGTNGDWPSAIDPQGRLWDGAEPAGSSAAQVVTVTDWHPDQATATATPLSGSLVQTGWGRSSIILSPDGKEVYADDRLRGTYSGEGPDQSATISVDTLVAESVPDPEEQLEGSDNPLIDVGSDYNFWVAMTQR